ncbi:hypothetical protein AAG570_003856 [Ranatra chinensis]|uniref:Uncharacterized protein n=1 Tax=Ranatra chinensis TaxID=642074 RepID=A0ABD0Y3H1_9HEMI
MGASQSTRRVTFDNDTEIKLSSSVVDRLKKGVQQGDKENEEPTEQTQNTSEQVRHTTKGPPLPKTRFLSFPYITSHQIQEEIERELSANNDYWEKRIASLIESQEQMNCILQEEYMKTIEELEDSMPRVPPVGGKLPCQPDKASVIKCYKMNPGKPLMCAGEVAAFTDCMTNMRIRLQQEGKLS